MSLTAVSNTTAGCYPVRSATTQTNNRTTRRSTYTDANITRACEYVRDEDLRAAALLSAVSGCRRLRAECESSAMKKSYRNRFQERPYWTHGLHTTCPFGTTHVTLNTPRSSIISLKSVPFFTEIAFPPRRGQILRLKKKYGQKWVRVVIPTHFSGKSFRKKWGVVKYRLRLRPFSSRIASKPTLTTRQHYHNPCKAWDPTHAKHGHELPRTFGYV